MVRQVTATSVHSSQRCVSLVGSAAPSTTTSREADDHDEPPSEPRAVQVYGLSLDGCAWSREERVLVDAKYGQLFNRLPVLVISAGLIGQRPDDGGKKERGGAKQTTYPTFRCPVYKYPNRTDNNWIFDVELPCKEGDEHWRLRGVCLLSATE